MHLLLELCFKFAFYWLHIWHGSVCSCRVGQLHLTGSSRVKATCYASSSRSYACRSGHDYLDSPALRSLRCVTILKSWWKTCENTLAKRVIIAAKSPEERNGGRRYYHCTNVCFVAIWLWWGHYQTEACARETYRNGLEDKGKNSMKISQWCHLYLRPWRNLAEPTNDCWWN